MKPTLALNTLFRSPVRSILTFVLLAVVSFAFFMRVGEYTVTRREINNAAKQYRGVGTAEANQIGDMLISYNYAYQKTDLPFFIATDPRTAQLYSDEYSNEEWGHIDSIRYTPLTNQQLASIAEIPEISFIDKRYMTAGISDEYYRLDEPLFYGYSMRCIVEATLADIRLPDVLYNSIAERFNNRLLLGDFMILAGNEQFMAMLGTYKGGLVAVGNSIDTGFYNDGSGSVPRSFIRCTPSYAYGTEYLKTLTPGDRYVFVLRFEPHASINPLREEIDQLSTMAMNIWRYFQIGDFLTDPWCFAIQSVEGEPENYLELEKFSALRELVEITNSDVRTFDVVYTEDLRSIMRFAETNMMIAEGRGLTREDSGNESEVCVISREVAREYGLNVGDTMTLSLGTELFEQIKGLGALAVTRERYSPPVKAVTLEIVGIYADTDGAQRQANRPHWSYSINTVFVPKSLLPIDEATLEGHEFSPSEVSFVIDNAWDIPAFLEEAGPLFDSLGLRLIFNDGGWTAIADNFKQAQRLSLINIAVFSAAMAMAMGFTVYLFIVRKKKEYAIMRALGTPKRRSALSLVVPLMAVSAVSVIVGSCAAWVYSVMTIENNNALQALEGYAVNASMPALVIIGCILGELALAALLATAMLWRLGAAPPLALLQGGNGRGR